MSITLKEVDGTTDRIFNQQEDNGAGQRTFVNIGTGGLNAAVKLIFNIKVPQNPATGRVQLRQRIFVPFIRSNGQADVGVMDCTYLQPVSFNMDERRELYILSKSFAALSWHADFVRDFQLPQ